MISTTITIEDFSNMPCIYLFSFRVPPCFLENVGSAIHSRGVLSRVLYVYSAVEYTGR